MVLKNDLVKGDYQEDLVLIVDVRETKRCRMEQLK